MTADAGQSTSESFEALGNETRMAVVRALTDGTQSFSDLFEATDVDTTAGFAYHLRQLTGQFVRKRTDERYELTYAGRAVARAAQAGTYTRSVDRAEFELGDPCPFCGDPALAAAVEDNVTQVACRECAVPVLSLSFPPSGYSSREEADLPGAFDSYHRHRIRTFRDGVCPGCGGVASTVIERVDGDETGPSGDRVPLQAVSACEACTSTLRCPVSLTVLSHPAVAAFYHDHGSDVRERPLWNIGSEWREEVVSEEPWCLCIRTCLDGEALLLYLARDGRVVDTRRRDVPESGLEASGMTETNAPDEAAS